MDHHVFINRCLDIARNGLGMVAPNPMVGAVLVHHKKIISEGYHRIYGGPHAEVVALSKVNDREVLGESTLYVNLEPCAHFGKMPPCASLILEKGIKKVVVSNSDPNPLVAGKGIEMLRNAGVEVITGVNEKAGYELNKRFFTFHSLHRPFVILKWAQTADGFIAPLRKEGLVPEITWISNAQSRLLVHKWRAEEQSILVGRQTVLNDDPELTLRHFTGKNPVRVILDPDLELEENHRVFDNASRTLIFNRFRDDQSSQPAYFKSDEHMPFLDSVLKELYDQGIQSIIVEGGAFTLNNFITSGKWDEARIFTSPATMNEGVRAPGINKQADASENIGSDRLSIYKNYSTAIR